MTQQNLPTDGWGTRVGVILAVTGSAVGLGNFLRFPGLAAQYGGGAFMIPYFVAFFILGLPIAWAEWSLGRYGGRKGFNSTPGIFYAVKRHRTTPYMGVLGVLVPVVIYMYYVFIEAWCLGFAWMYLRGSFASDGTPAGDVINAFVGIGANGSLYENPINQTLLFVAICFVLNFFLIYRGLAKGIEWFCRLAMPALIVCALIVLARVMTLGTPDATKPYQSVLGGLGYMWNPASAEKTFLQSLANPEMWLAAAGQIFFSLSIGFGVIATYASYLKKDDDIALSSVTAASGNLFCEVGLGGLITIPAAFIFLGVIERGTLDSSFALGFKVLPLVFDNMPGGRLFGFLFFFLLFLAAVTSSLSMLQPAIAFLEEGLGLNRKASVTMLGFVTLVGAGFVTYFSHNLVALDTFDFWVGTFCIFMFATIQVIYYGWVLGIRKGRMELERGAEIRVPIAVQYTIKYVAPIYLLVVFGTWLWKQFVPTDSADPTRLQQIAQGGAVMWSVIFIGIVLALFALLIAQAGKRWRRVEQAAQEVSI